MRSTSGRILISMCTAVATGIVLAPSSALAAPGNASSLEARVQWVETGEQADAAGNAHIGVLTVREVAPGVGDVAGSVVDLQCIPGATPRIPGDLPGEEEDEPCVLVGVRHIEGRGLALALDKKLTAATLTGDLAVGADGSTPQAAPTQITWQGEGPTTRTTEIGADGSRTTVKARSAVIGDGSHVGDMVFDDEPMESASGRLAAVRTVLR